MRAKDKCPSCYQPIAPTDFLCPHCELILDASQMPEKPGPTDVSVVRRMLEAPQRGMPAEKPNTKLKTPALEGLEGPTRKLDLGPELAGVPVVVATLSKKSGQLSELEAWVVSLIDGLHDAKALATKAGVREFELRVVLRTLNEKQIIDFADEPLSDADLDLPEVMGELAVDEGPAPAAQGANVDRRDGRFMAPATSAPALTTAQVLASEASFAPPMAFKAARPSAPQAMSAAPPSEHRPAVTPSGGRAAVPPSVQVPELTHGAGSAPASPAAGHAAGSPTAQAPGLTPSGGRAAVSPGVQVPELSSSGGRAAVSPGVQVPELTHGGATSASRPDLTPAGGRPAVPRRPASLAAVPYPGASVEEKMNLPPARAVGTARDVVEPRAPVASRPAAPPPRPSPPPAPVERTDPRIAYTGPANRKVLDALKKVKRANAPAGVPSSSGQKDVVEHNVEDVLARDTLQVALRMEQGGRFDEAIRFLEKSIAQSPEAPSLYNRLGIILMRERADYRRAEQMIKKAHDLAPENSVYSENLKQVIQRQALGRRR